jgi:hypothetical protein
MSSKKKAPPKKKPAPPAKAKPVAKPKAEAKPAAKPNAKKVAEKEKPAAKAVSKAPSKSPAKSAKPAAKAPVAKPKAIKEKQAPKKELPKKQEAPVAAKQVAKPSKAKVESLLIVPGVKFIKVPFFQDIGDDKDKQRKRGALSKMPEKPTASSRPKIGNMLDTKNLVELLSQQLEFENKMFFEGCEGQICVKCNLSNVDSKFYVDKSLGYCTECAALLGLGQSKEGVFSDAQMELMRRSMEKSIGNAQDIDEDNIESALGDIDIEDSLELEALLAAEEEAELNA